MKESYKNIGVGDINSNCLYDTPQRVAQLMVERANIQPTDEILEPSAGKGAILKEIFKKKHKLLTICEMNRKNYDILYHDLGIEPFRTDFFKLEKSFKFDKIIMNPPFKLDVEHILKAIYHLKRKGQLIALVHYATLFKPMYQNFLSLRATHEKLSHSYFDDQFSGALITINRK